jgi:hypothetical protein
MKSWQGDLGADRSPEPAQGAIDQHGHGHKGDHHERILNLCRIVGDACRAGGNDRRQSPLLGLLVAEKGPPLSAWAIPHRRNEPDGLLQTVTIGRPVLSTADNAG